MKTGYCIIQEAVCDPKGRRSKPSWYYSDGHPLVFERKHMLKNMRLEKDEWIEKVYGDEDKLTDSSGNIIWNLQCKNI